MSDQIQLRNADLHIAGTKIREEAIQASAEIEADFTSRGLARSSEHALKQLEASKAACRSIVEAALEAEEAAGLIASTDAQMWVTEKFNQMQEGERQRLVALCGRFGLDFAPVGGAWETFCQEQYRLIPDEIIVRRPRRPVRLTGPRSDLPAKVLEDWDTAWQRLDGADDDGAITAALTLAESVCKHILAERGLPTQSRDDIPDLWKAVKARLAPGPSEPAEADRRQIAQGATNILHGLTNVRNRQGDAHGRGPHDRRATPSDARAAVFAAAAFVELAWEAHSLGRW